MSAVMIESNTPAATPSVSENIELKPNRQFRRLLQVDWGAHRSTVSAMQPGMIWQTLASVRVDNHRISLWSHRVASCDPPRVVYSLDAADCTFYITQREFDILRAKLEPRGVKVHLPEEAS